MADRIPVFEVHIRPLFRLIDREHMAWAFDLWDYSAVVQNADVILSRVRQDMPPRSTGGPWPSEWVTLFERWMTSGYARLLLGQGTNYLLEKSGGVYTLSCEVEIPATGSRAWLEVVNTDPAKRTYLLYVEPPVPAPQPSPSRSLVTEEFEVPESLAGVYVVHAAGTNFVAVAGT